MKRLFTALATASLLACLVSGYVLASPFGARGWTGEDCSGRLYLLPNGSDLGVLGSPALFFALDACAWLGIAAIFVGLGGVAFHWLRTAPTLPRWRREVTWLLALVSSVFASSVFLWLLSILFPGALPAPVIVIHWFARMLVEGRSIANPLMTGCL